MQLTPTKPSRSACGRGPHTGGEGQARRQQRHCRISVEGPHNRSHTWGSALTALAIRLQCAVRRLIAIAGVSLLAIAIAGTSSLICLHLWRTAVHNAAQQLAVQNISELKQQT